jgi:hypothetical protein
MLPHVNLGGRPHQEAISSQAVEATEEGLRSLFLSFGAIAGEVNPIGKTIVYIRIL